MLQENEKNCIKAVLGFMSAEEVHMLAQAVTNNLIVTATTEGK
jgi:hypothetical protein